MNSKIKKTLILSTPLVALIFVFSIFSGIILFSSPVLAYTPPLGIPDPGKAIYGWGTTHPIDSTAPDRPAAWPSAEATNFYYIDKSSTNATDTGNTFGYPDKPRATIPTNPYAAGSYIELHGGDYNATLDLYFNGTQANPIWFRGTPGSMPTISGKFHVRNSKYVIFEYLDFNGGNDDCIDIIGEASNHISIRNSSFRNRAWTSNTAAIGITPYQGGEIHNIVIYNSEFYALGDWLTTVDQDFHGINPDLYGRTAPTNSHDIWMLNNNFYHISGNGVQVNAAGKENYSLLHHIYIGNNTGHDNRQSVLWAKQGSDIIISQNTTYSSRSHGPQPGDGIGYQYGPDKLWIIFNTIYDCNNGIRQSDTNSTSTYPDHTAYIIGNLIYNIHPEAGVNDGNSPQYMNGRAINLWQGYMNRYIVDNTIYDVFGGINVSQDDAIISGNIISDIDPADYHVSVFSSTGSTSIDYNMIHNPDSTVNFRWGGTTYTSLTSFQNNASNCLNCWVVDPQFIDPANNNFNLKPTSPAKGKGFRNAVYDTFLARYGISIAYDIDGNPRPASGTGWNLGAFQSLLPSLTSIGGTAE